MTWVKQSKRNLAQIMHAGLRLVYPTQCACCQKEMEEVSNEVEICETCRKRLVPPVWNPCPRCGGARETTISSRVGCVSCSQMSFLFETVIALGGYHTDLQESIARMKWSSNKILALAIGDLLATERRESLKNLMPDMVVPIPMHWLHRFCRGMNSPDYVASSLSKQLEIPLRKSLLVRCKKTRTQSELPPKMRYSNVRGSFRVRFPPRIRGRRILLVDDVLTTGATCNEAAKVLKQAGAAWVVVAVVARAQGENR
jgi:ComF family protein